MSKFIATHNISHHAPDGALVGVWTVMLTHEGTAYTREEWENTTQADWERTRKGWRYQGQPTPGPGTVKVERIRPLVSRVVTEVADLPEGLPDDLAPQARAYLAAKRGPIELACEVGLKEDGYEDGPPFWFIYYPEDGVGAVCTPWAQADWTRASGVADLDERWAAYEAAWEAP